MSLIGSLLAFVVIPLKAKPKPKPPTEREGRLEADAQRLTFALDHWRSAWHALWADNERLREERDALRRELALRRREDRWLRLGEVNAQMAQQAQQQNRALALQNAQYQGGLAQQLGMQQAYQGLCNCVPSRSQMLDRGEE